MSAGFKVQPPPHATVQPPPSLIGACLWLHGHGMGRGAGGRFDEPRYLVPAVFSHARAGWPASCRPGSRRWPSRPGSCRTSTTAGSGRGRPGTWFRRRARHHTPGPTFAASSSTSSGGSIAAASVTGGSSGSATSTTTCTSCPATSYGNLDITVGSFCPHYSKLYATTRAMYPLRSVHACSVPRLIRCWSVLAL